MVRFWRMAVVLGLITAVGPFAIDMYLPALPTIGGTLRASPSAVQLSMTVFFITIGLCQMIYGPLSDIIGRKTPIYIGLLLFVIGSIGCALAPSIEVLVGFRIIQALGACAGMVIPRAIVRDLHTGPDAAQLMSLLMLVVSISPMLAPLSGSAVLSGFGWRGIFWVLAVAAVVSFLIALLQLKETLPADQRAGNSWGGALGFYRKLIVDPAFVGLAFAGGCGLSTFFVFIGSAAFVYINHFGLSQTQFSLLFALNAIGFFGFSQLTGVLGKRFGDNRQRGTDHRGRREPAVDRDLPLCRQRLPRAGAADDRRAQPGAAWRDRRHRIGAARLDPDDHGRRIHGRRRSVLQWRSGPNAYRHRAVRYNSLHHGAGGSASGSGICFDPLRYETAVSSNRS
jgi:Bcr/CflA subfamily drug resistance transporter